MASSTGRLNRLEGLGRLEDHGHLGFDRGEVVLGERAAGEDDVVVEAGGGGRLEGELGAREEPHDGARHDVRGRMAEDVERLAVLGGRAGGARSAAPGRSRAGDRGRRSSPSATAATAASARRRPIPSAISRGRTPSANSLTDPSGSLIWTMAPRPAQSMAGLSVPLNPRRTIAPRPTTPVSARRANGLFAKSGAARYTTRTRPGTEARAERPAYRPQVRSVSRAPRVVQACAVLLEGVA